jgi:tetratricopeptide (TPR) repeat protein
VNIHINKNFRHSANWSTNRRHWGYNPWWNRPACRPWYGGSWHCGWKSGYRHGYYAGYHSSWPGYSAGAVIGWGLAAWGLGALIYNVGYNSYQNPYPTQAVPTTTGTEVDYSEPITLVSAETAPKDDEQVEKITQESESFIEKSQNAFREKNYVSALDFANKAVGEAPGDGALHEYRALVLFALGKYGEAAGVLNPLLASGPGWDWTTMVKLYDSQKTYTDQLRKLEEYTKANKNDAAPHFLLGYHYMVCGYIEQAQEQFEAASKIQPADSVARELANLLSVSATAGDEEASPAG